MVRQAAVGGSAGAGRVDVRGGRVDAGRGRRRVAGAVAGAVPAARRPQRRVRALRRVRTRRAPTRGAGRARGSCVVVGGRTAALAPVPDLAAAIVVDDADEALQEERSPTWHARDVLYERAARAGASWAVVSPAPTVEALAVPGVALDALAPDVEARGWPRALVVDRREEPPGAGLLTESLADALRDASGTGGVRAQPARAIPACSRAMRATRCCAGTASAERPMVCDECGATRLRVLRAGRDASARGAGRAVPAAARARRRRRDHRSGRRRHRDRHRVGAAPARAAPPAADAGRVPRSRPGAARAAVPRGRAGAVAHDRGARSCSRAGRATRPRLVVQTRQPDHEVVRALVKGQPALVTDAETERRRALGFPPFGALAEISGDERGGARGRRRVARARRRGASVQVLGPTDGRALVVAPTPRRSPTRSRSRTPRVGLRAACASWSTRRGSEPTGRGFTTMTRWRLTRSDCSAIRY